MTNGLHGGGGEIEFYYPSRAASKCTTFTAYIPMEGDGIKNSGSCERE
jgi:hypothetical protein